MTMTVEWKARDNGSYRLSASSGILPTVAVSPIKTPADPDWQSKPSSLEAQCSAEAFNRIVGWTICGWHWSVVETGRVLGAGDATSLELAQSKALEALPKRIKNRL